SVAIDIDNPPRAGALKIVWVQRGPAPGVFVLAPFGGGGPLHAAALASELGIVEVICPPIPGAFSALGLVATDLKRDYVQTLFITADTRRPRSVRRCLPGIGKEGICHARSLQHRTRTSTLRARG